MPRKMVVGPAFLRHIVHSKLLPNRIKEIIISICPSDFFRNQTLIAREEPCERKSRQKRQVSTNGSGVDRGQRRLSHYVQDAS